MAADSLWVDSDVLLDWLGKRPPWNVAAAELIRRAALGECGLWFSPLTLANVFYIYREQAGTEQAKLAIEALLKLGQVATLNATHVRQALASGRADFEDELQTACAASVPGLSAIITRNLADYRQATPAPQTAETWLAAHPHSTRDIVAKPRFFGA